MPFISIFELPAGWLLVNCAINDSATILATSNCSLQYVYMQVISTVTLDVLNPSS